LLAFTFRPLLPVPQIQGELGEEGREARDRSGAGERWM